MGQRGGTISNEQNGNERRRIRVFVGDVHESKNANPKLKNKKRKKLAYIQLLLLFLSL